MSVSQFFFTPNRVIDSNGISDGATIEFFVTGTTTPQTAYANALRTTPLANPLTLAAGAAVPAIYLDPDLTYRVRFKDSAGNVIEGMDYDPYIGLSADGIAYTPNGTGAVTRTLLLRGRSEAYVSDYGSLAQAIASGARKIKVDVDVGVTSDVTLGSNQTIECTQGRIVPVSFGTFSDAVLKSTGGSNITLRNLQLDASAITGGAPGLKLLNCNNVQVEGGKLKRTNMLLESTDNTVDRGVVVSGTAIDMNGYASVAVYCSGINGVALNGMDIYGGQEGVGIYNNARNITHNQVRSHDHTQDAFVIIAGQQISYSDCYGYDSGQSGFTTQRQTSGANTRIATWTNCFAYGNAFDGFDIRGANSTPWNVDTAFQLTNCQAWQNDGVGFYVVNAEATNLTNCVGRLNNLQNLFIDASNNVLVSNFRSISGAAGVASGVGKAGIYVANSTNVEVNGSKSGNTEGATQEYGITFAGTCANGRVIGGDYLNNSVASHSLVTGVAMKGAVVDKEAAAAVTLLEITPAGCKYGECFGEPRTSFTLNWTIGSFLQRADGGGADTYNTAGSNNWYKLNRTVVP